MTQKLTTYDLLSAEEKSIVDKHITEFGYFSIDDVRNYVTQNYKTYDEYVDGEDLLWLDVQVNYPVFMTKDYIYRREELLESFPFKELGTTPERVFVQQKMVVKEFEDADPVLSYQDIDDDNLDTTEDKIRSQRNKAHKAKLSRTIVVESKFYIGKNDWDDFKLMKRFVKVFSNFLALEGPDGQRMPSPFMQALFGAPRAIEAPPPRVSEAPKYYIPELEI